MKNKPQTTSNSIVTKVKEEKINIAKHAESPDAGRKGMKMVRGCMRDLRGG